jgi:Zn-dependent protease with chaperone function
MNARPATLKVKLYDGRKPIAEEATLLLSQSTAKLIGAALARDFALARLRVSPRVGTAARFVALPDGGQLQCADSPALDRLPQEGQTEGIVAWLERRWWVALACLALTVGGLAFGYVYGLPAAAEHIAARVPLEYERKLGEQSIVWLDQNGLFAESELDPEVRQPIADGFTAFTRDLPLAAHYRLEFRAAPVIGPNAFALPGGIVVVTDELVELSDTPEEVLAVLAHEIGHVEQRHALRHLLQDSATAVLAATFTSDASSLTLAVSGLPVLLARTKYSREFEAEADAFGFALLKRHQLSPEHFATVMEKLRADGDEQAERELSFVSTHPVTADRIARARAASR